MSFKTPSFWYRPEKSPAPLVERALAPLSYLYGLGRSWHVRGKAPQKASLPVICVGNVNAGGSGKTPSAIALMDLIQKSRQFQNPYFLTRDYGGDEAVLLTQKAPTVIHADRFKGAQEVADLGGDLIIMDDGFQNPGLAKDLEFVVIDGAMGFGNRKMIPAGPLREPLQQGLSRADAFILINTDERDIIAALPREKPVFRAHLEPHPETSFAKDRDYVAFAGIGYPEKFFTFLRGKLGLKLVRTKSFPDHHPYDVDDLRALVNEADGLKAQLITTEKDILRVPDIALSQVSFVKVVLKWDDEPSLLSFLNARLVAPLS